MRIVTILPLLVIPAWACARASAPSTTVRAAATQAPAKARVLLVPVAPDPIPFGYSRFSRDGRFVYGDGFLYDRGDCSPRARVEETTMQDLETTVGSVWEPLGPAPENPQTATLSSFVPSEDMIKECGFGGGFDPVARLVTVACSTHGAEYEISSVDWESLPDGPLATAPCLGNQERSDIQRSFGIDLRWSDEGNVFTYLELEEGWNYHRRTIHVVDLRRGTHERIDDDDAADRGDPPSYARVMSFTGDGGTGVDGGRAANRSTFTVNFEPLQHEVFVERADGVTQRLFDDHLWPDDAEAESPWSSVTPAHRFRTSADPFSGEMLSYGKASTSDV